MTVGSWTVTAGLVAIACGWLTTTASVVGVVLVVVGWTLQLAERR